MTEQSKLLASIALFSELCDTNTNLKDILNEFIKALFTYEKIYSLNSLEAVILLKKHFEFDIPEAVVRTCLNSMKAKNYLERNDGTYSLTSTINNGNDLISKLEESHKNQLSVEELLIDYAQKFENRKFNQAEKDRIKQEFFQYLLENKGNDTYSTIISSFIILKSKDIEFIKKLNQLKEGLVLILGIKYTNDFSSIGTWSEHICIYLDQEHLFNSFGLNGEVYQRLFNDFYSLVREINIKSKKEIKKDLISLLYFDDTKKEIDYFFHNAEKIVLRESNYSPENLAMESICKGCFSATDVIRKKTEFYSKLNTLGIKKVEEQDYYSHIEFNIVDVEIIEKFKSRYSEEVIEKALKSFTKINFLRKGINATSFEKCKHITLTGKVASLVISKDLEVKHQSSDIPFVTDIEFLTNRIWFKLNKGFSKESKLPASLDVLIKAQIIISSQISKTIDTKYDKLTKEFSEHKLSKEDAQSYYFDLRERAKKPEEITLNNLKESIEFIFENDLDKHLREKSLLQEKIMAGESAQKELRNIRFNIIKTKKDKWKGFIRFLGILIYLILILIGLMIPYFIYLGLAKYKSESDTNLSIFSTIIFLIIELLALWKFIKPLIKMINKNLKKWYVYSIKNIR